MNYPWAWLRLIPWKTRINELKMFTLIYSFLLSRKRQKRFMRFPSLHVHVLRLDDALTDVCTVQFTTTKVMTTWNKQTSTILARKPVAVFSFEGQSTRGLKGLYVNCRDFFYTEDFVGSIGIMLLNLTPLCSQDIYASTSQKEEISKWNKQVGQ